MNNMHCRTSHCFSMLHASHTWGAISEEQATALWGSGHWQRGERWAAVEWPTCLVGVVTSKHIATSRGATAHKLDTASHSPESLHPANGVDPRIAIHARSWAEGEKRQLATEDIQGRCWLSLLSLLCHHRETSYQFARKHLKQSCPNRSHLRRAVKLWSRHLLVYRGCSTWYEHGMLYH